MSIRKEVTLLSAGLLLLLASILPASAKDRDRDERAADVKVVNTPNVKVVNTPSVNIANTPTVNVGNSPTVTVGNTPTVTVGNTPTVTVGNTPTVNVGNTPSVTVSNTSAQPIFVNSISDPGRTAFQSIVNNTGKCSGGTCFWEFGSPTPGHRIVIEHVSALVGFNGNAGAVSVLLNNGSGLPVTTFFGALNPPALFTSFDHPVLAYFDSPQIIEVQVDLIGATFPSGNISEIVSLSGYELDCNAAPCAPIAH